RCARIDCEARDPFVLCCLDDGSVIYIEGSNCTSIGGRAVLTPQDCQRPGEPDCRFAEPDREPVGGYRWSLDLCQNAAMDVVLPPIEDEPRKPGYGELATMHPVRLTEDLVGESCKLWHTPLMLDGHGYGKPLLFSDYPFDPEMPQRLYPVELALQAEDDPDLITKPGYGIFYGAYHAPPWSEAIYRSPLILCQGPPV
ncbi:MAG: hypothetical protein JSU86_04440, partial [Phycisphaerales bacterium]